MRTSTTVIKAATLIDGTGVPPRTNMALIIEGDKITDVRPASSLPPLGDRVTVYDDVHLTAMPGIIDCHDHLAHLGKDLKRRLNTDQSLAVLQTGRWATETLMIGVTSFRDAGGVDLGVKMAVDSGVIPGPRLFISLVIITQTGGHGDLTQPCGISSDFPRLPGVPDGIADGVDACRRKVREVIRMGADCIKVATTGGVGSPMGGPTTRQFTLEELRAMVDEAHAAGKPVLVHAHGGEGLRMCLAAGVDSIEHAALAEERDLERMAALGIWLVPTLSVTHRLKDALERDPNALPAYTAAKLPAVFAAQRRSFQKALECGVKIAMGTDAGALGHAENTRELAYMVRGGMTPMQSIVASTKMGAQLLGMGDSLGTLEPGRLADLLLVDGDPLQNIDIIANPKHVRLVMKGGVVYKDTAAARNPREA